MMTSKENQVGRVGPAEAEGVRGKHVFLDVRTPAEYEEMHIPGSVLQPLQALDAAKVKGLLEGREGCVVVCRSGQRAAMAAEKLSSAGVGGLKILSGGVLGWESAGLPLNRGERKVMPIERQARLMMGAVALTGGLLAWFVNPAWAFLSMFAGAGLMFSAVTDWCGLGLLLMHAPWNRGGCCGDSCGGKS